MSVKENEPHFFFLPLEIKTEFNSCRKHGSKLKEKAHTVKKDRQQKEIMESRLQFLETTVKRLEEELSVEKRQKKELVENTARLNKMCDEMKEDIRLVKKMLKERKEAVEILSDSSENALSETTCEERSLCYSRQGESIVVDRIPNSLEREKSFERPEEFSFPETATPAGLNEFEFEGKFAVDVFHGVLFASSKPTEVSLWTITKSQGSALMEDVKICILILISKYNSSS